MDGLTARQLEVVAFIQRFKGLTGYPPTQQEMADHFGIRINALSDRLWALERKGAVTVARGKARSIAVSAWAAAEAATLNATQEQPSAAT
jgi:SOS-response transcriptional repressor LexA